MRIKVTFFQRRAYPYQFSIEKIFDGIKAASGKVIETETNVVPFFSHGLVARIKNVWWCRKRAGRINHITGDIHYVALGLPRRGTILTIHDLNFMNHPSRVARAILYLFWLYLPVWWVQHVTVISEATKDDLMKRLPRFARKVKVIPNFFDSNLSSAPKQFNKEMPRILQVGTKVNKNVRLLIQAIGDLNCILVIIGMKDVALEKLLQASKITYEWLNNLTDAQLAEQYIACDIVSLVSTIEGFGLPILEAQATGRAVITSNVSSMPEVAGGGACLVNPLDSKAIRNGIEMIIKDDSYRKHLISVGFENVKRYTLTSVSESYLELYTRIDSELN